MILTPLLLSKYPDPKRIVSLQEVNNNNNNNKTKYIKSDYSFIHLLHFIIYYVISRDLSFIFWALYI